MKRIRSKFDDAYWNFRARCRQQGHRVLFNRLEFRKWWTETGKWEQRGHQPDDYCMSRKDKTAPFSLDNIVCIKMRDRNLKRSVV